MDECNFDTTTIVIPFKKGTACSFAVEVAVAFPNQSGSSKPDGLVDLAVWKRGKKDETLICLEAKGYQATPFEESTDEVITRTTHGHGLLILSKKDESQVEGLETPLMIWLQGGNYKIQGIDCVYDPATTEFDCKHENLIEIGGAYIELCPQLE